MSTKRKKVTTAAVGTLMAIAIVMPSMTPVSAAEENVFDKARSFFGGEQQSEERQERRAERKEDRKAIAEAVKNADYDAFLAAAEGRKILETIDSEADFNKLVEAHELRQEGNYEEAKVIMEELGLKPHHKKGQRGPRQEVRQAVEANDYDAFQEAVADTPLAEKIDSEEDFAKFVEAQELRKAGDKDGARAIMEELGFEKREGGKRFGGPRGANR